MKKLLLYCSAILIFHFTYSQEKETILLNENFTNNSLNWPVLTSGQSTHVLYNGKYVMENTDGKSKWSGVRIRFNPSENYTISATATHIGGLENQGFGIYYGAKNGNNGYAFCITASGFYSLFKYENGNVTDLIRWTESSAIRKGNYTENSMAIIKEAGDWKLYANGKFLNSFSIMPSYGDYVGFYKASNQRIEFDSLQVKGYAGTTGSNAGSTEKDLYNDDFSETTYQWNDVKTQNYNAFVREGKLTHEVFVESSISTTRKVANLDNTKDYSFSINASHAGGQENYGFGLIFGGADSLRRYYFVISASGFYTVCGYATTIFAWTSHASIKKGNFTDNFLMLKKEGSTWKFYVNNQLVNSCPAQSFKEALIGAITYNKQKVEYDNIILRGFASTGTATTGAKVPENSSGSKIVESGNLCKLLPKLKLQSRDMFRNITGQFISEAISEKKYQSTYSLNEASSSSVGHTNFSSRFYADFAEFSSKEQALKKIEEIRKHLTFCIPGLDAIRKENMDGRVTEYRLIEKITGGFKDLRISIKAVKNAASGNYAVQLNIPSRKYDDPVWYLITGIADQSPLGQQLRTLLAESEKDFKNIIGSVSKKEPATEFETTYTTKFNLTGANKCLIVESDFDMCYEAHLEKELRANEFGNAFDAWAGKVKKALGAEWVYTKHNKNGSTELRFIRKENAVGSELAPVELLSYKSKNGTSQILLLVYTDWMNF